MRFKIYIRVLSREAAIRGLHKTTMIPGASIQATKAKIDNTDAVWWNWQTEPELIEDILGVEDAVHSMLTKYRPYYAAITKFKELGADVYLEVVHYFHDGELPCGLALSVESIALLDELGAALDYDAVPDH